MRSTRPLLSLDSWRLVHHHSHGRLLPHTSIPFPPLPNPSRKPSRNHEGRHNLPRPGCCSSHRSLRCRWWYACPGHLPTPSTLHSTWLTSATAACSSGDDCCVYCDPASWTCAGSTSYCVPAGGTSPIVLGLCLRIHLLPQNTSMQGPPVSRVC